jgi:NADPH2:quinone reductase
MRAIEVQKTGPPEVLTLVDIPVPRPKANEVLVKIAASGVNFADVYYREGRYTAKVPFIDGQEAAGVVTQIGTDVTTVKVGDRVAYTGTGVMGTYAEHQCVPADRVVKLPDNISDEQAAAMMLQGMTAHYLLHSTYPLKNGDTVLVHAAAGGMGLLLTQWSKYLGATVIGTAGSDEKAAVARAAGADEVIVYTARDFESEVKRITGGRGVDVVYDGVGKDTFTKDLHVLRPRGYLVLFGGASGAVPPFDPILLTQHGSLFLTRPSLAHHIATREELEWRTADVMNIVASGKLTLRIGKKYRLEEAEQAHRDLEGRRTTGKLLLVP